MDFRGRWMPEPQDEIDEYLGEHGWAPAYSLGSPGNVHDPIQVKHESANCPAEVFLSAGAYLNEANGYDCSLDQSHTFLVPHPLLISGMGLRWSGNSAECRDTNGALAAFDPDATGRDAFLLMREDLLARYVKSHGLALMWTVLGEKMTVGGRRGWDWTGSLHITGGHFVTSRMPTSTIEFKEICVSDCDYRSP